MSELLIPSETNFYNPLVVREDFPLLHQFINGHPLVYLDNAATTQKPACVIAAMTNYYQQDNANIHRGVHTLSVRATDAYENVRALTQRFINASNSHEIIFTKGTTEGINLIAHSFGQSQFQAGDEIILSELEHHSNIVPWQLICQQKGVKIRVIPINEQGELELNVYENLINAKTKLVAITHVSNAIGTINPIKKIIAIAHQHQIPVLVDGAQAVPHMKVDVQDLDCDFYVFSGHKMYGPTGIGVLYGKSSWLNQLPPYQGGGDMITQVSFENTVYNKLPHKFEAGTPNIAGVIGLGAAINYLQSLDLAAVAAHEMELLHLATDLLQEIKGVRIFAQTAHKAAVVSFLIDDIHPHDIGTVLDHEGIAIRAGHHCAMPLMNKLNVPATARISFGLYNTKNEITRLDSAIRQLKRLFSV